jgi:hypothetical protein
MTEAPARTSNSGPIKSAFEDSAPEVSLVQNRLNVAGLALTALFFSGSFSLSLFASLRPRETIDYRSEFAHIETTLALGVIFCMCTVSALLVCQQLAASDSDRWYHSPRLWFAVGSIGLYFTLSQALSAGLTEVVYGVAIHHRRIGVLLALMATVAWLVLLVVAPIHLIRRVRQVFGAHEIRALSVSYVIALVAILVTNADTYRARGGEPDTVLAFVRNVVLQLVQPATWVDPWDL